MATESQLHILAHTGRILRREIENILAGGLAPEDAALEAGYREAVRRLRAIAQEADAGRTASLLALFQGLPALLPSLSQAGVDCAAAALAVSAEAAGSG
jgi:hypothetical protein